MNDEIRTSQRTEPSLANNNVRHLVPMKVGNATVYVEQVGAPVAIQTDEIRPVSPPTAHEAFEKAGEILHECVRMLGERIESLASKAKPSEIEIEFSLSFEVKGKASIIPVILTGESTAQTGIKVTAKWKREEQPKKEMQPNTATSTT